MRNLQSVIGRNVVVSCERYQVNIKKKDRKEYGLYPKYNSKNKVTGDKGLSPVVVSHLESPTLFGVHRGSMGSMAKTIVHRSDVVHRLDSTTPHRGEKRHWCWFKWNCSLPVMGSTLMFGSESAQIRWCSGMLADSRSRITVATL